MIELKVMIMYRKSLNYLCINWKINMIRIYLHLMLYNYNGLTIFKEWTYGTIDLDLVVVRCISLDEPLNPFSSIMLI